jgi:hypothetical protein
MLQWLSADGSIIRETTIFIALCVLSIELFWVNETPTGETKYEVFDPQSDFRDFRFRRKTLSRHARLIYAWQGYLYAYETTLKKNGRNTPRLRSPSFDRDSWVSRTATRDLHLRKMVGVGIYLVRTYSSG